MIRVRGRSIEILYLAILMACPRRFGAELRLSPAARLPRKLAEPQNTPERRQSSSNTSNEPFQTLPVTVVSGSMWDLRIVPCHHPRLQELARSKLSWPLSRFLSVNYWMQSMEVSCSPWLSLPGDHPSSVLDSRTVSKLIQREGRQGQCGARYFDLRNNGRSTLLRLRQQLFRSQ